MTRPGSIIRTALLTVLALTALAMATAPAAPAKGSVAKAKARLRAVAARLDTVSTQSEIAVEKLNQATARLETIQAKIDENQRHLQTAQENLEQASEQLLRRAEDMYKARDVGIVDFIFQADSFDDLISQMDMMQRLGNSDVDTVHAIAAYKREIKDRRLRLKADEKAATRLVAERERHRNELVALESDLRALTKKIKKQIKKLKAQARLRAQLALTGYSGPIPEVDPNSPGHPEIIAIAKRYFGVPYVWGGASPSGFDCSGLTMYCYAQIGVNLYHGATMQQRASSPVALTDMRPGDLIFFGNASFSHHVAIFVGGTTCIEAPHTGDVVRYGTWTGRDAWIGGRF
ncbi:MAG TPA: NlpC/P60 family protein [Thermoleophilia bacterium]|nr:NlpC/P60 family protein [Acidobacteriota bacterium]HOU28030.1 NlpC/P60 family protein [Thermoleophilia bacterium]HQF53385.1 NlpC/P60 family protein [Thermoleophilia bacterium]HQJ26377.1 NlpC/P60 family protein [Thermoleophilia bacterium]